MKPIKVLPNPESESERWFRWGKEDALKGLAPSRNRGFHEALKERYDEGYAAGSIEIGRMTYLAQERAMRS